MPVCHLHLFRLHVKVLSLILMSYFHVTVLLLILMSYFHVTVSLLILMPDLHVTVLVLIIDLYIKIDQALELESESVWALPCSECCYKRAGFSNSPVHNYY